MNKTYKKFILSFIIIFITLLYFLYKYNNKVEQNQVDILVSNRVEIVQNELINQKNHALSLAILFSKNQNIISFLENNKPKEEVTPFDEPKATITIKEEQKIEKVETKIIPVDSDGKVMKTLSCSIRVPAEATDEQVINAVINMIKGDKFPIENIKVM